MKCKNCNLNTYNVSFDMYKTYFNKYFTNLPIKYELTHDLWLNIFKYLINFKEHKIIHTKKSRMKPDHMEYDSDGEYYWEEYIYICTKCFQNGLNNSLIQQQRLPYLRRDVYYFINFDDDDNNNGNNEKNENNMFINYFLPNDYEIKFYRQKNPLKINNNLFFIGALNPSIYSDL